MNGKMSEEESTAEEEHSGGESDHLLGKRLPH